MTRDAVFVAATECAESGKPTQIHDVLAAHADIERAFAEWETAGGSGVSMRVTNNASGQVAAVFEKD